VQANGLAHARRLLVSSRLKMGTFRLPLVWDDSDEVYQAGLRELPEQLKLAADVGATRALTSIAPANDIRPYHENFEFHRRRLTEIGEALAASKMQLGVEFLAAAELRKDRAYQFIHSFDALVMLVSMVRAVNVGAVADAWQIHAAGSSIADLRKLSGQRIIAAYVSDAPAEIAPADLADRDRLLLGETSTIDNAALLSLLAELGFDGPVSPRVHRSRVEALRRDQLVKLAGSRLDEAWKAAHLTASGKLTPAKS
jgi:sugar phosphate isomerase/epimerase